MDFATCDELIGLLYNAATSLLAWGTVLDEICAAFQGWNAHLMGLDLATGVMLFSHEGGDPPAQGTLEYIRTWHRKDPRAALVLSHPPGRWFHCHEHFDEAFVATNDFYQEFLLPYGMRYISGFRFDVPGAWTGVFSVSRAVGAPPFDDEERADLQRLGQHVRAACELQDKIKRTVRVAFAGYAVLDRLNYPVFVLDEHRVVLFGNAASANPDVERVASCKDGRLRLRSREDDLAFTAAVKTALSGPSADGGDEYQAFMRVGGNSAEAPALLHISATRPNSDMGAFGPAPTLIVTFFLCGRKNRVDPYIVSVAFGLSPAEARVATAIAEGASVKDIARKHQTAPSTVRSQLKVVFEKLGVHRQAELAQLLMGNPALWARGLVS